MKIEPTMTNIRSIHLAIALLAVAVEGFSQGFVNLDFEDATFVSDPSSPYFPNAVYASNAIPGWLPYVAGNPVSLVYSNDISLGGGAISIIGANYWSPPQIQGQYYILLAGVNYPGNETTASIGQTAQIPNNAL